MTASNAISQPLPDLVSTQDRIQSIDLLRGVVMIIMALDHTKDYFFNFEFGQMDLTKTTPLLFFTRWITHYCAPVFIFLAGTSAFFTGRRKSKKELTKFLITRGLWLVFLELTVIAFGWRWDIRFYAIALNVIWALGICMIVLAAAIHLPLRWLVVTGVLMIVGHNLLDSVHVAGDGLDSILWAMLHEFKQINYKYFYFRVGYPVVPWIGVMMLGYAFGNLYLPSFDAKKRRKILYLLGIGAILLFFILRLPNIYGDPKLWMSQRNSVYTFLSIINVTKYPPSLLYVLIMLGPALIFLAATEKIAGKFSDYIARLGRVPMFYYILHIYLIHFVAGVTAALMGYDFTALVFSQANDGSGLKGFGFGIYAVYAFWIGIVLAMIPVCLWYERYKRNNRDKWWLSYL
ncbi:membrane protein [Cytophagales bacterium WSM2-2]|nr:membrane protein [Cytophagales bacterium WSM2-2]